MVLCLEPEEVWIALPKGSRTPTRGDLGIEAVQLSSPYFEEGVFESRVENAPIRLYNLAKTTIDCFKFRHKVGLMPGVLALHNCLAPGVPTDELLRLAHLGRVERIVRSHIAAWVRKDDVEEWFDTSTPSGRLFDCAHPLAPTRTPGRPTRAAKDEDGQLSPAEIERVLGPWLD